VVSDLSFIRKIKDYVPELYPNCTDEDQGGRELASNCKHDSNILPSVHEYKCEDHDGYNPINQDQGVENRKLEVVEPKMFVMP
jgi:hypothetical protein